MRARPLHLAAVAVLWALGCLWSLDATAQPPPLLSSGDSGLTLTRLPPILEQAEIRRQLDTGLTTTFLLKVTGRDQAGRAMRGGARVQIRYELWDEIYQLASEDLAGHIERGNFDSLEALVKHWQELSLEVIPLNGSIVPSAQTRFKVELDVIPFSRSEEQDTRRWFSESIERSGRGNAENVGQVSEERSETLGEVFNLLMATSIQRRAIMDFHWQVPISRKPTGQRVKKGRKDRP